MILRRSQMAVALFFLGCILAAALMTAPGVRVILEAVGESGYVGALVSGIFYAISVTAPLATVFFLSFDGLHPFWAALFGGLGALLYDVLVFEVVRHALRPTLLEHVKERLPSRYRLPTWTTTLVGAIILASPLPDELAAGFLGLSSMRTRRFLLLSFLLNSAGIFVILLLT